MSPDKGAPGGGATITAEHPIVVHPEFTGETSAEELAALEAVARRDEAARVAASDLGAEARGTRGRDLVRPASPAAQSPPSPELASEAPRRAYAVDALRGLFLILMTIGFALPSEGLPLWMYHRQTPPPTGALVDIAGISWRDLAYGAFLFTMAAALPLTMARKIAKGGTEIGLMSAAVKRYLVLVFFALLIGHSNTYFLGYTQTGRVLAVVGFGIMALVFTRRRPDWSEARFRILTRIGWIAAVAFLAFSPLTYDKTFSVTRYDEVIAGLAFASLAGSALWYFTRENLVARLVVLAAVMALYLGAKGDGWVNDWWWSSPLALLFIPSRLILLAIVIPGTIVGDAVLRWMHASNDVHPRRERWSSARLWAIVLLGLLVTPIVVLGAYHRAVALETQVLVAMMFGGLFLTARPAIASEQLLRSLFLSGASFLLIGLFMEPFEGGIRKIPDTLTYFFTMAGLTTMLLLSLTALLERLNGRRFVAALIDVGHNPLLAYVLFTVLINSILEMIVPLRGVLSSTPGEMLLRTILEVTGTVLIVRAMSRRRIYWRT